MFNDTDTTEIYTDRHPRSLHDARPICPVGLDPEELFDVVIGTEENLATWEQYLLSWPNPASRMRVYDDGTIEDLGRVQDDVHERVRVNNRSEEHTSELQSLMRISYAVFCLNKKHEKTHCKIHRT